MTQLLLLLVLVLERMGKRVEDVRGSWREMTRVVVGGECRARDCLRGEVGRRRRRGLGLLGRGVRVRMLEVY